MEWAPGQAGSAPPRLARWLLALSGSHLLCCVGLLFLVHLSRAGRLWEWLQLASVAVQADLMYVVCFLLTSLCTCCWLLGVLTARSLGCNTRAGLAVACLSLAAVAWYSLVKIAELHDLEVACRVPSVLRLPDFEAEGPRGLFTSLFCLPVGALQALRRAFLRPLCCLAPKGSPRHLSMCPRIGEAAWWEWRELLVGSVAWLSVSLCLAALAAREPRRHSHAAISGALALLATFALTAEPLVWFWCFLARPLRGLRAGPLGAALPGEERLALLFTLWLAARLLYLAAAARWERRRERRRVEERLRLAALRPFRAELEEGFGLAPLAREAAAAPEPAEAAGRSGAELAGLQAQRRALIEARRRLLRGGVASDALLPSRLALTVRRAHLLPDSLWALADCTVAELLAPSMSVGFDGEQGVDAGGLSKDWFDAVARALAEGAAHGGGPLAVAPDGALTPGPAGGASPPGAAPAGPAAGLRAAMAAGRFLALALLRERPLPVLLSPVLCRHLLRLPLRAEDVRRLDPQFFRHRVEAVLRRGGVAGLERALCCPPTFVSAPGLAAEPEELLAGGAALRVTEENKAEYVRRLCEAYACGGARCELACFLEGFWDLLPPELLQAQRVSPEDLSALVSGACGPDLEEWRQHSCSAADAELTEWFWESVEELAPAQRCLLLRFVTGSSRPPPGGFGDMRPPFSIDISSCGSPQHLPQAHTCTNRIVLPRYTSKAQLLEKLGVALSTESFALA